MIIVLLLLLPFPAVPAAASPVTWDLTATFTDGATAIGTFSYDASTSTYSDVSIVTTPGAMPGTIYDGSAAWGSIDILGIPSQTLDALHPDDIATFDHHLRLIFDGNLSIIGPHDVNFCL
jgi:hypothetical protein